MEITGKIIMALPEQSGVSKAGNQWKKREYVLETLENYPKKVHFDLFGDRADQYPLNVGDEIVLSFDINSREFNGRWYTSISGWKVEKAGAAVDASAGSVPPVASDPLQDYPAAPPQVDLGKDVNDDLPF